MGVGMRAPVVQDGLIRRCSHREQGLDDVVDLGYRRVNNAGQGTG
jgi:hypothetical protein